MVMQKKGVWRGFFSLWWVMSICVVLSTKLVAFIYIQLSAAACVYANWMGTLEREREKEFFFFFFFFSFYFFFLLSLLNDVCWLPTNNEAMKVNWGKWKLVGFFLLAEVKLDFHDALIWLSEFKGVWLS